MMALQSLKMATAAVSVATGQKSSAWNQLDQLLTCAICLDRYRNPKLLPCQHTFCMEPCLEGLIDYVRRQIKCPECRAEHRIPYQGIQGYPTNVTLMRFLELHFEVSGEVPDPTPTMMERCGVCTEKSYLSFCAHCEKKVCAECKESHLDIMKREISRINNQVRRGLHRIQDAVGQTEKSAQQLQNNSKTVVEEIEQVYTRLQKELRDRQETLKNEVITFVQGEVRNAKQLKENLEIEVSNMESNCDLVEKHVTEQTEWEDIELMGYKDTFLRMLEFLRNFDPDQADFNRRLKFQLAPEPEAVHNNLANVGELTISAPNFPGSCVTTTVGVASSGGMLMRSKSEHRLASSQVQRHETYLGIAQRMSGHSSDTETREGRSSPLSRRRTSELSDGASLRRSLGDRSREHEDSERSYGSRRYGREYGESRSWQRPSSGGVGGEDEAVSGSSYRSRYSRESHDLSRDNSEGDLGSSRSVRFARQQDQIQEQPQVRERVFETEDATRGPMSGIARLMDVPRVMQKLQQHEQRSKLQKIQLAQPVPMVPAIPVPPPVAVVRRTARQVSEEDEISKQKAQNKVQQQQTVVPTPASPPPPPPPESPTRPLARRVAALQREESTTSRSHSPETEMERRRYGDSGSDSGTPRTVTRKSSRDVPDDVSSNRPASRQSSTVEGRPSSGHSSARGDKSTTSSESSSKEEESPQPASRRKFFTKNPSVESRSGTHKSSGGGGTPISETTQSGSDDSDSESKTPTPQTGTPADDPSGIEKPNYFRFRTAAYSRSPSNSSVNLNSPDSQDETAPTYSTTSRSTEDKSIKERSKSTDSSSSGSSESSSNVRPSSATSSTPAKKQASVLDKKDKTVVDTRYAPFRGRTTPDLKQSSKDETNSGVSSARVSSLSNTGRTYSFDRKDETAANKSELPAASRPRFVSRFLPRTQSLHNDDKDSSSDSDSDDESKEEERKAKELEQASPISALLARSAIARRENPAGGTGGRSAYGRDKDTSVADSSHRTSSGSGSSSYLHGRDDYKKDTGDSNEGRYSSLASKYLTRSRPSLCEDADRDDTSSKYGSSYANRYLSKSKSSAALSYDRDDSFEDSSSRRTSLVGGTSSTDRFNKNKDSGASRYGSAAAARRSQLGRSKSSHELNGGGAVEDEDDDVDDNHYGRSGSTYRTSRFERPSTDYAGLSRSRSHHLLNSREPSPSEDTCSSSSLSSWARYLKNKYGYKGNLGKETKDSSTTSPIGRSRSSHTLYSREASSESSEEERGLPVVQDGSTRRNSIIFRSPGYGGLNSVPGGGENPRSAYLHKRKVMMKIGSRGSDQGCFTWPRGIAVGPDNNIVVADSSNHRVQVFDAQGSFCKEYGAYGSSEGEFDCLAGVAVNRIGQYMVSDRYNHRIQVFDPSGRFLRAFGSQGSVDGKLSYPWGIATDSLGFIYVCDKENHRVQVFQSDGTFVGKFGSLGSKAGQLEHPHYIAVSSTNKVIVSDSNNHRVQIFDVNGRVLSTFGVEGSDEGQFKFPRGVAVDDQGFIIVGDSGNNRIQVFTPDGTFLKSFGTWGSGDGEFKGLEGVAVTSNGHILVCDRENHRIQIF